MSDLDPVLVAWQRARALDPEVCPDAPAIGLVARHGPDTLSAGRNHLLTRRCPACEARLLAAWTLFDPPEAVIAAAAEASPESAFGATVRSHLASCASPECARARERLANAVGPFAQQADVWLRAEPPLVPGYGDLVETPAGVAMLLLDDGRGEADGAYFQAAPVDRRDRWADVDGPDPDDLPLGRSASTLADQLVVHLGRRRGLRAEGLVSLGRLTREGASQLGDMEAIMALARDDERTGEDVASAGLDGSRAEASGEEGGLASGSNGLLVTRIPLHPGVVCIVDALAGDREPGVSGDPDDAAAAAWSGALREDARAAEAARHLAIAELRLRCRPLSLWSFDSAFAGAALLRRMPTGSGMPADLLAVIQERGARVASLLRRGQLPTAVFGFGGDELRDALLLAAEPLLDVLDGSQHARDLDDFIAPLRGRAIEISDFDWEEELARAERQEAGVEVAAARGSDGSSRAARTVVLDPRTAVSGLVGSGAQMEVGVAQGGVSRLTLGLRGGALRVLSALAAGDPAARARAAIGVPGLTPSGELWACAFEPATARVVDLTRLSFDGSALVGTLDAQAAARGLILTTHPRSEVDAHWQCLEALCTLPLSDVAGHRHLRDLAGQLGGERNRELLTSAAQALERTTAPNGGPSFPSGSRDTVATKLLVAVRQARSHLASDYEATGDRELLETLLRLNELLY